MRNYKQLWLWAISMLSLLTGCGRGRSDDLEKALKLKDDAELCSSVFKLMIKHYGEDFDVSKCKENDQVVILTYHASGIIDNGGFQYLFEGDFKGDPYFERTVVAFKAIKADICAASAEDALKLFPNSKPPAEIEKRLAAYERSNKDKRMSIDAKFFSQSQDINKLLAKYIRDNRDNLKHLK